MYFLKRKHQSSVRQEIKNICFSWKKEKTLLTYKKKYINSPVSKPIQKWNTHDHSPEKTDQVPEHPPPYLVGKKAQTGTIGTSKGTSSRWWQYFWWPSNLWVQGSRKFRSVLSASRLHKLLHINLRKEKKSPLGRLLTNKISIQIYTMLQGESLDIHQVEHNFEDLD